ncbi:MAG: polymer-forming cytoskeletal protein [Bacteroidota bacterium]
MAKSNESETPSINLLGAGTTIKGEIISNGDFRIDGTLVGSINSKGKLVIGASGSVEGSIICQNADFSGNIKAKIEVAELLTLKATAKLTGDIVIGKLSIEPGAQYTGTCNMHSGSSIGQAAKPMSDEDSRKV